MPRQTGPMRDERLFGVSAKSSSEHKVLPVKKVVWVVGTHYTGLLEIKITVKNPCIQEWSSN